MRFRDSVAENCIQQLESTAEIPARVLKPSFAQGEREPGDPVKVPASGHRLGITDLRRSATPRQYTVPRSPKRSPR